MYNPNVRAENSKEVIANFPSVRLASEKQKVEKMGRGKAFLSSLLLTTFVGACCFGAGYKTKEYTTLTRTTSNPVVAQIPLAIVPQPTSAGFRKTIEDIITKDLGERGIVFLGNFNDFTTEYATKLLGRKPDEQQLREIKACLENKVKPVQTYMIEGSRNLNGEKVLIYRMYWR